MWAYVSACFLFAKRAKGFGTEENCIVCKQNKEIHRFFVICKGFWRSVIDSKLDLTRFFLIDSISILSCFARSSSLRCGSDKDQNEIQEKNYRSSLMLSPLGSRVFALRMRCASRALRTESLLLRIFLMGISRISLEEWLGISKKCLAEVVGEDLEWALSSVRRCSLNRFWGIV